ncbi:MAG: amino acid ABC transporter permease [Candidatus Bipolaricaulota bacterium]
MTFRWEWLPSLAEGLILTLEITGACVALGIVLGTLLAVGRVYGRGVVRALCGTYIEFFRGTPLLVQVFIVYFGLPTWGINLSGFASAILALGLNTAAYQAEYLRGALQAVGSGQLQAARSVGMSLRRAVWTIVFPQAFRIVLPAWSNELIQMLKYSSIVFTVSLYDLMGMGKKLASKHFTYLEVFIVVALFYLAVVFFLSQALGALERRLRLPGLGVDGEAR